MPSVYGSMGRDKFCQGGRSTAMFCWKGGESRCSLWDKQEAAVPPGKVGRTAVALEELRVVKKKADNQRGGGGG